MLTRLRPQKKAGRPRAGRECQAGSRTGGGGGRNRRFQADLRFFAVFGGMGKGRIRLIVAVIYPCAASRLVVAERRLTVARRFNAGGWG